MDKLFLTVLNMSLTGAFVIAAVILARLPLKKAPKIISYCLWAVVGFRLICPFAIDSTFSLIPFEPEQVTQSELASEAEITFAEAALYSMQLPGDDTYVPIRNPDLVDIDGAPFNGIPMRYLFGYEAYTILLRYLWPVGVAVMLLYGIVSYALLKRRMRTAIRIEENLYETDNIPSPFVLGIIKPKIYLPLSLAADERDYIILHEQTHIRRHDHIVKFAAYFILCLHWFNPLAWVAFLLMGVDMEMSCDERVLKEMGGDTKHDYSRSLLSLATKRRMIGGSPLAYSEGGLKQRIKNVLNFRKPSRVIITLAVVLVAVLSVGFAVNRVNSNPELDNGDLRRHDTPESISIYNSMGEGYRNVADDIPLLVIEDSYGIELFYNMIKKSESMPGILDVMASPYVATINYGSTVEIIELYLSFPNEQGIIAYEGMYINHSETHYGYKFQTEDVEVFLQAYRTELYDVFMEYLKANNGSTDSGAYKPSIMYENVIYSISPYRMDTYTIFDEELTLVGTVESVVNGTTLPQQNFQASGNTDLLNCNIYTVSERYPYHLIVLDKNGSYSVFIEEIDTRYMTLKDVRTIAEIFGENLTLNDLREFIGTDIGSGLHIPQFSVDDGEYYLTVGAGGLDGPVLYAYFGRDKDVLVDNREAIDIRYYDIDKFIADGTRELVRPLPESQEIAPPAVYLSPTEIVRQELLNDGCKIEYVFLMSAGARKALNGVDNGDLATVYASYTEGEYGDAIYCMRYDFERATADSAWTHNEPTFWDGIAVDVAAYVARSYYAEQTGVNYEDVVVSWAYQEDIEALYPDVVRSNFAVFYIGVNDGESVVMVLTSPDGQSHWKVVGYDGDRT